MDISITPEELEVLRNSVAFKETKERLAAATLAKRTELVKKRERLQAEFDAKAPVLLADKVRAEEAEIAAFKAWDAAVRKSHYTRQLLESTRSTMASATGEIDKELRRTASIELLAFRNELQAGWERVRQADQPRQWGPLSSDQAEDHRIREQWQYNWNQSCLAKMAAYRRAIDASRAIELEADGHEATQTIAALRKQLGAELKAADALYLEPKNGPDPTVAQPNSKTVGGPHSVHKEL